MSVIVAIVVCTVAAIVAQTHLGWNYEGALHRYYLAMEDGDADNALYWIDRAIVYSGKHLESSNLLEKALVFEMGDRYREAKEIYDKVQKHPDANVARLYYKSGQKKQAYDEYRAIALEKGMLNNDYRSFIEYNQFFVEHEILLISSPHRRKLSIFETVNDFIQFMEQWSYE